MEELAARCRRLRTPPANAVFASYGLCAKRGKQLNNNNNHKKRENLKTPGQQGQQHGHTSILKPHQLALSADTVQRYDGHTSPCTCRNFHEQPSRGYVLSADPIQLSRRRLNLLQSTLSSPYERRDFRDKNSLSDKTSDLPWKPRSTDTRISILGSLPKASWIKRRKERKPGSVLKVRVRACTPCGGLQLGSAPRTGVAVVVTGRFFAPNDKGETPMLKLREKDHCLRETCNCRKQHCTQKTSSVADGHLYRLSLKSPHSPF